MNRILPTMAIAGLMTFGAAAQAGAVTVIGAKSIVITSALPDWLQISELVATDFLSTNVALGGVATASSVYQNGPATPDKAIDGNFGAVYPNMFHSGASSAGQFLKVTLAAPANLASLAIFGRSDCCSNRDFFNFSIYDANDVLITSGQLDARSTGTASVAFDAPTAAIPEPATWAMMLMGFGGAGYVIRRRKAKVAYAAA